jgi:threonine dehydrogenase-like Zn-dependent dehydrogenase
MLRATSDVPSDLHEYLGGPNFAPSSKPHPITNETIPITIGHEFSGVIKEMGDGVTGFYAGQKVRHSPFACWIVHICLRKVWFKREV